MTQISRRPTRAAIERSLRELQLLWKPPPENDNARRAPGAAETELHNGLHSTPARVKCKGAA